jgi:hypothetical protein
MYIRKSEGPRIAQLPDGRRISAADLPPPDTTRWVARRKLQVVEAVSAGLLSAEKACERYDLSGEELQEWCEGLARHGIGALQATKIQIYRQPQVE